MTGDEVRAHPGEWAAFFSSEVLDDGIFDDIDWEHLRLRSEAAREAPWDERMDLDVRRSIFHDAFNRYALTIEDPVLQRAHEKLNGFTGTQIRSLRQAELAPLGVFEGPAVRARLRSASDQLTDVAAALLCLDDADATLWTPRADDEVCERYRGFLGTIPVEALRQHVAGFFRANSSAADGAMFMDDSVRRRRHALVCEILTKNGTTDLPPFVPEEDGPRDHASWEQCPCDGRGPYGTFELELVR